jgi:methylmalonyl-CoA/ethylmalonyl-CoA epimerase
MKIKRIEHVGVVVKDTEASRRLWEGCFGIPLGGEEENDRRKLALYYVGESMVELIAGKGADSKHQRMVAAGKGGLNHICFEVENIDEAGCRIAFIDPKATENCLIELAELPRGHRSSDA